MCHETLRALLRAFSFVWVKRDTAKEEVVAAWKYPTEKHHLTIPASMHLTPLSTAEPVPSELCTPLMFKVFPELPRESNWARHGEAVQGRSMYIRALDRACNGYRTV